MTLSENSIWPNLYFPSLLVINKQANAGEPWWIIMRIDQAITAHSVKQFIIFWGRGGWETSGPQPIPLLINTRSMLNKKAKEDV